MSRPARAATWLSRAGLCAVVLAVAGVAAPSASDRAVATSARPALTDPAPVVTPTAPADDTTLLVGVAHGASAGERRDIAQDAAGVATQPAPGDVMTLRVRPFDLARTIAALRGRSDVRYVERNARLQAAVSVTPNDPQYPLLWALQPGSSGHVNAPSAWGVTTGSAGIVVGVLDTGIDATHPDLAPNVWTNPGGIGGCPAGSRGYDVVANDCDPTDDQAPTYHGTHVSGTIGAVGNNGTDVVGVNWHTTILPLKMLNATGSGDTVGAVAAIQWAINAKAAGVNLRVLNASWGGPDSSQALRDAITAAGNVGILFVAAAGNSHADVDGTPFYPCAFGLPTEVCVAATDSLDQLASFSNFGANRVDLAAPGVGILSTRGGATHGYQALSGTSMATPHVTGAAALALAARDQSVTALRATLVHGVDPVPSLTGAVASGGRLDLCKVVTGCGAPHAKRARRVRAEGTGVSYVPAGGPVAP